MSIGNHAYNMYFFLCQVIVFVNWRLPSVSSSRRAGLGSSLLRLMADSFGMTTSIGVV
jgi:hypothetical protein